MKILLILNHGIGDTIMALPMVKAVSDAFRSRAHIYVLVRNRITGEIIERSVAITDTILVSRFNLMKLLLKHIFGEIRFDFSITGSEISPFWGSLVPFLLGIKVRIGEITTRPYYYTSYIFHNRYKHTVYQNLDLAKIVLNIDTKRISIPKIKLEECEKHRILTFLEDNKIKNRVRVGIVFSCNPKRAGNLRRWGEKNYAELVSLLIRKGVVPILIGSNQDKNVSNKIKEMIKDHEIIVDATGIFSIFETIELIKMLHLIIGNDAGLMHIAAMYDIPSITLFFFTNCFMHKPFGKKSAILKSGLRCSPCNHLNPYGLCKEKPCREDIKPMHVFNQAIDTLHNFYDLSEEYIENQNIKMLIDRKK